MSYTDNYKGLPGASSYSPFSLRQGKTILTTTGQPPDDKWAAEFLGQYLQMRDADAIDNLAKLWKVNTPAQFLDYMIEVALSEGTKEGMTDVSSAGAAKKARKEKKEQAEEKEEVVDDEVLLLEEEEVEEVE